MIRTLDEWKGIVLEALEPDMNQTSSKALAEQIKEDLALVGVDDVTVVLGAGPATDNSSIRVSGMVRNLDRREHHFSALLGDTPPQVVWKS